MEDAAIGKQLAQVEYTYWDKAGRPVKKVQGGRPTTWPGRPTRGQKVQAQKLVFHEALEVSFPMPQTLN